MASVWSSSRLPPARSRGRDARVHVQHADGLVARDDDDCVASLWPARMRTSGTQTTLRSSRSAMLFCGRVSSAPERVEVHRQQLAAVLKRAVDHLARHPQIALARASAAAVARDARLQRRRRRAAAGIRARPR